MTTQDITALTSLLCALVTYEVEISAALEASDLEISNYMDFRYDLSHAIATALDPETAAQIRKLVESVGEDELAAHVLAVVVAADLDKHSSASSDKQPRTLRESIDREWPW